MPIGCGVAYPSCPDHPGSKVVRAGLYGVAPHQRQRWLCTPGRWAERHRFTEVLPRVRSDGHRCTECERRPDPWEGAKTARTYNFTTREIAHALIRVAQGSTYTNAAHAARELGDRLRPQTRRRPAPKNRRHADTNYHGQLVGNWVEVFGPVIAEAYRQAAWPERVAADSKAFRHTRRAGGQHLWALLVAVGYPAGSSKPSVSATRACGHATTAAYQDLFASLGGQPALLVSDGGTAITGAAASVWGPATQLFRCEWHLERNIREAAATGLLDDPTHPITQAMPWALKSPAGWAEFKSRVAAASTAGVWAGRLTRLDKWVTTNDALLSAQTANRPRRGPTSVGPVEAVLNEFGRRLGDRAVLFRNAQRTNALVSLMALDMAGRSSERDWAELIRAHLAARSGVAPQQRQHDDARTAVPSLWV